MAAESKNSFLDSLVKIGQGFQDIFGIFGNAIGDALGFNAVKSGDKRSKVGEHFERIKKGLGDTKDKLKELSGLSGEISEAKNANGSSIEVIKGAIRGSGDVFDKLIGALTKLVDVAKEAGSIDIGDTASAAAAVAADKASVETIIAGVKAIIDAAKKSGIEIKSGTAGNAVNAAAASAPAAIGSNNAGQGAGDKLAAEVSKADPWAMIDKIKNSTTNTAVLAGNDKDAGTLATGTNANDANGAGAATNADLAAAVALKAITKGGKFSAAAGDVEAVKAAAASAVNKVLGILDFIIRKTVSSNLDKIKEAVKGMKYFETTTEATEASTIKPDTK
ncbi:Variable major protein (plasmid) [Borrelia nietonii YOR]|uniref:Variable large protein n=1 Tax=Borrelia nietonii YOR TaxID=1293576 RepID=W5SB85_9SPIR|nr:Variable major protein [Borrelia nietonii YOR]